MISVFELCVRRLESVVFVGVLAVGVAVNVVAGFVIVLPVELVVLGYEDVFQVVLLGPGDAPLLLLFLCRRCAFCLVLGRMNVAPVRRLLAWPAITGFFGFF